MGMGTMQLGNDDEDRLLLHFHLARSIHFVFFHSKLSSEQCG